MNIIEALSRDLNITNKQVESAISLINEGNTLAFIARYRKELTGSLSDEVLRELNKKYVYYKSINERAKTILDSMEAQGVLTDELKDQINKCEKLTDLEDIYRPYKPKKKTRASIAKEKGLEPIAKLILEQKNIDNFDKYLESFINQEKKVNSKEEAIQGAKDIIAEIISDDSKTRNYIKIYINKTGFITSKVNKKDEKDTFINYYDYEELIKKIPNHRILALNRGENLKCLKVGLKFENDVILNNLIKKYIFKNLYYEIFEDAIKDSLTRLIYPSIENEIRNDLFERAEDASILVFEKNLKQLLMAPALKNKIILGFDPGFRTGCKIAIINKNGDLILVDVLYLTSNSQKEVDVSLVKLKDYITKYNVDYIALGNGTASRESEFLISKLIKENNLKCKVSIVNESGASIYSASKLGQEEFPNLTVEKRSAISLARRLQDPLAEMVKIDPKNIGVGQYQHDLNQNKLEFCLNAVVEECVNGVGVDINTASASLLQYVSGISKTLAKNIIEYRVKNGRFNSREELKEVKQMGPKAFEQCAGFLRIYGGIRPLDMTAVHPESYEIALNILNIAGFKESDILKEDTQEKISLLNDNGFFNKKIPNITPTQIDIIQELIKPGHDVRDDVETLELDNNVKDIKDLKVGMVLTGVVHSITDFGAFVDINVHQDGLVHISEVSNKFVKDLTEVLSINQIVKVKVISVDVDKKRIGLSIKQALEN